MKARHILISPKVDSLDVTRAKREADSVVTALGAGASFDSLAKKHHDYPSGEELIDEIALNPLAADEQIEITHSLGSAAGVPKMRSLLTPPSG